MTRSMQPVVTVTLFTSIETGEVLFRGVKPLEHMHWACSSWMDKDFEHQTMVHCLVRW